MLHTNLANFYMIQSELVTGADKYFTITELEEMIPFERDLYIDLIMQRNQKNVSAPVSPEDKVITDFEEFV